jgi:hypothetical protein
VAVHDARTGRWAGITATDRDGRYTLWVPAGADYRVVAAPLNAGLLFADEWFRDAAQATQALAIAVTETNITGGVDFELTPRTALGIDVTPNSGAWSMTVRPAAYAGPTSGIGDLALALAPTGVYSVTFGPMAGWQTPQPRTAALSPDTHVVVRAAYNGVPRLSGLPGFWVLLGDTVRFDVMATDPDGSTPSLSTTAAPSAAVFTDHGDGRGRFYWVPSGTNSLGDHEVVIAATDGQAGDTAAAAIHVSSFDVVRPTNGAAILQGGIVDVSWTGQWPLNRVDVDLLQGTNFVARVATNVVAATTAATYSGVVPPGVSTGADYRIEVTDRDNPVDYDRSPAFSVVSSGPWASAVPRGGPWFYSDWFGYFADLGNGWMWHQMHGFLFALGTDDSSLWFWGPNLGWFWTSRGAYPFLYSFHRASWMYYWRNTVNPQGFWNLSTGQNEWVW